MKELTKAQLAKVEDYIAFEGKVELLKWIDTSAHGFKITLRLKSRAELDDFDGVMTRRKRRGGQRYYAIIQPYWTNSQGVRQPDASQQVQQEWQFAGRGWAETQGAHIAVHIADAEAIAWWRMKTCADQVESEKRGGLYYLMLMEIGDDEIIVNQVRREIADPVKVGGPRSKAVAMLLQDLEFLGWLSCKSIYSRPNASPEDVASTYTADDADVLMKGVCRIKSKIEFDHDGDAAWEIWENQFRRPFIQYMERHQ